MKHQRHAGFTLVEVMVASSLAAILAGIAYPSFQGVVLKSRRVDGVSALMQLHLAQERWRGQAASYATLEELRFGELTALGYYRLTIDEAQPHGFVATATATGFQQADEACRVLRLTVSEGMVRPASGSDEQAANPPAANKRCWNT